MTETDIIVNYMINMIEQGATKEEIDFVVENLHFIMNAMRDYNIEIFRTWLNYRNEHKEEA